MPSPLDSYKLFTLKMKHIFNVSWWSRWILKTIFMTTLMLISFGASSLSAWCRSTRNFDGYIFVCLWWLGARRQARRPRKHPPIPRQTLLTVRFKFQTFATCWGKIVFPLQSSATARLLLLCGLRPSINFHFRFLIPPALHERRYSQVFWFVSDRHGWEVEWKSIESEKIYGKTFFFMVVNVNFSVWHSAA